MVISNAPYSSFECACHVAHMVGDGRTCECDDYSVKGKAYRLFGKHSKSFDILKCLVSFFNILNILSCSGWREDQPGVCSNVNECIETPDICPSEAACTDEEHVHSDENVPIGYRGNLE